VSGHGSGVNKYGWVTWVMGQLTDGSGGSWVTKCDLSAYDAKVD